MKLKQIYRLFLENAGISTDSRKISPGSIFFALKGETFDANQFASNALSAGASYAVVDDPKVVNSKKFILVDNVLETLQQIALHHRRQFNVPVIGITGSNGKTTTKELIAAVIGRKFNCLYTPGNLNNHIGVPLSILRLNGSHHIAIIEMGANHIGEVEKLCKIALPTYGLITNIGKAHLEGFGSYEGVIEAKTELYQFIRDDSGKVFLNSGDNLLAEHAVSISKVTYSLAETADYRGVVVEQHPFLKIACSENSVTYDVSTQLTGMYNAINVMAATCIGRYFGVSVSDVIAAIYDYVPSNNRSQILNTGRNTIILDAYNANPSSMAAALDSFRDYPAKNKICILGDMMELGPYADDEHSRVITRAAGSGLHKCIFVGNVFFENKIDLPETVYFESTNQAQKWLNNQLPENSTILIKGSRKMQLETLVNSL